MIPRPAGGAGGGDLLPLKVPLAVLVRTVQPSAFVSLADCCSVPFPIVGLR